MATPQDQNRKETLKEMLQRTVGFYPRQAVGWLYVARGLYKMKEYHWVIEAVGPCLRNDKTAKEAQHFLAFSLMHTGQIQLAAAAFFKSVQLGNETDWQPLVELVQDNPMVAFTRTTKGNVPRRIG
eukprot:TRINITY_DN11652_c0_g1_i1.p1 TRINITY_DN11652_c0_g1~~TRINITY_DN11652_c0_g1_i1.p1  ORF type:complete len:126 (-),score=0.86 TRINITY_DN11652_c0_g1_i1:41-418(-)